MVKNLINHILSEIVFGYSELEFCVIQFIVVTVICIGVYLIERRRGRTGNNVKKPS